MADMTAKRTRMRSLVKAAAEALDDGKDPFDGWFLDENKVTLDEAYELADTTAMALRLAFGLPLLTEG
jgi:hypothetical protein